MKNEVIVVLSMVYVVVRFDHCKSKSYSIKLGSITKNSWAAPFSNVITKNTASKNLYPYCVIGNVTSRTPKRVSIGYGRISNSFTRGLDNYLRSISFLSLEK
jgi:hypothetical protein